MAREFDPENLTIGDVFKAVAPTLLGLAFLFAVGRYAPNYIWPAIILILALVFVAISRIKFSQESLEAMARKERETQDRIESLPVVGKLAGTSWKVLKRLFDVLGIVMLIVVLIIGAVEFFQSGI